MIQRSFHPAWLLVFGMLLAPLGCGGGNPAVPLVTPPKAEHAHPHNGPHGGILIELGEEEYHAELAHDDATKTVTIYVLGKDAKTAVPIAETELTLNLVIAGEPLQSKFAAAPQDGDPAGQASRFTLVDEKVLEAHDAKTTTGRLNITIAGKPYVGKLDNAEHGHEHK